jgi:hypothetical protein
MAYTTGMSKEGKKIFNSGSDEDMKKLSPEDKAILDKNIKKDCEKQMKQVNKFMGKLNSGGFL